jgi:AraC-like DNA-binding protein
MPGSSISTFTDPGAYQEAVGSAQVEVLVTARGRFRAELARIDLPQVSLQAGRETLPRVGRGTVGAERTAIYFLIGAEQTAGRHCGAELSPGEIVVNSAGSTYHHRSSADCHWGDVSLSPDALAAAGIALAGRDPTPADLPRILRPRPALMSRLSGLHEAAINLAQTAPDVLCQTEVAHALEQDLVRAVVASIADDEPGPRYLNRRHRAVLARFEEVLAERVNDPLHLAEICAAIGTPERTLRLCCQEHLGMGPIRYLWLRRMHLARQALARVGPNAASVTSVAIDHGFWELGKFSVAYRALFGESPSTTLRRSPDDAAPPRGSPLALSFAGSA